MEVGCCFPPFRKMYLVLAFHHGRKSEKDLGTGEVAQWGAVFESSVPIQCKARPGCMDLYPSHVGSGNKISGC